MEKKASEVECAPQYSWNPESHASKITEQHGCRGLVDNVIGQASFPIDDLEDSTESCLFFLNSSISTVDKPYCFWARPFDSSQSLQLLYVE